MQRIPLMQPKATPHKEHLAILHVICLHIFRHLAQKSLDRRQPACTIFAQSDKKSDGASDAQSLCDIALKKHGTINFVPCCLF
jgi:hypothetical protein